MSKLNELSKLLIMILVVNSITSCSSVGSDSKPLQADLIIYNLKGQIVKSFLEYGKGEHSIVWNGDDDYGNNVNSGIYFYQLSVNGHPKASKKCLLLK